MNKLSFQSLVREYIKEYSSPKETVKKSEIKAVIKECLRVILNEVMSPQKKTGPYSIYVAKGEHAGKYYLATKDENGLYYFLHPDTGTDVPIGTEENGVVQVQKRKMEEMTTTDGGTPGYQIPGWLSRRGGSKRGVEGSRKLGYELTPAGEKEMKRQGDRLV